MKHPPFRILLSIFCLFLFLSPELVFAGDLSSNLSVRNCRFWSPSQGAYVETYVNIQGGGLRYEEVSARRFRTRVELTMMLRKGDLVLNYEKYVLESPLTSDTTRLDYSITDMRRMYVPEPGLAFELIVRDLVDTTNEALYTETLSGELGEELAFSDVQLIDTLIEVREPGRFTKHGYELVPWAVNYYPHHRQTLIFYAELYGSATEVESGKLLLTASIRNKGGETINNNFWLYEKKDTSRVVPFLRQFDIGNLPTGNYDLVLETRDQNNEILASKRLFFQRTNLSAVDEMDNIAMMDLGQAFSKKYAAPDLYAYLSYIKIKAAVYEQQMIESLQNGTDTVLQQQFLYNFWLERDESDPYAAWLEYLSMVRMVNREFPSVSRPGYRTDRGRVYLQYGPPSDLISVPSEPGAKPYQIWYYNTIDSPEGSQGNIKFIFYDPSLVSNDFRLIHSNALGELQNPRWQLEVYGSTVMPQDINNLDNEQIREHFGGRASDYFDRQ